MQYPDTNTTKSKTSETQEVFDGTFRLIHFMPPGVYPPLRHCCCQLPHTRVLFLTRPTLLQSKNLHFVPPYNSEKERYSLQGAILFNPSASSSRGELITYDDNVYYL